MVSDRSKRVAILQSNYIPWKGYFDIIAASEEFLIFDEVQFTRRDWRNRNRIVQGGKSMWLTIPVESKGEFNAPIDSIRIADPAWARKHWSSLVHAYGRSACFKEVNPWLEGVYKKAAELPLLTDVNELFLRTLCDYLDIPTPFVRTRSVPRSTEDPTRRLVELCVARGAGLYISGPAAKAYIDNSAFVAAGVGLAYANYSDYPVYAQGLDPFEHGVSILDLIFRFGKATRTHLKAAGRGGSFLEST